MFCADATASPATNAAVLTSNLLRIGCSSLFPKSFPSRPAVPISVGSLENKRARRPVPRCAHFDLRAARILINASMQSFAGSNCRSARACDAMSSSCRSIRPCG